jgi:hypothetical protein
MTRLNTLILLAVATVFYLQPHPANASETFTQTDLIVSLASDDKDYDPGKEITDNPHGPNPHGPDPHGPSPYEEQHDKNLPANNPDRYFNK